MAKSKNIISWDFENWSSTLPDAVVALLNQNGCTKLDTLLRLKKRMGRSELLKSQLLPLQYEMLDDALDELAARDAEKETMEEANEWSRAEEDVMMEGAFCKRPKLLPLQEQVMKQEPEVESDMKDVPLDLSLLGSLETKEALIFLANALNTTRRTHKSNVGRFTQQIEKTKKEQEAVQKQFFIVPELYTEKNQKESYNAPIGLGWNIVNKGGQKKQPNFHLRQALQPRAPTTDIESILNSQNNSARVSSIHPTPPPPIRRLNTTYEARPQEVSSFPTQFEDTNVNDTEQDEYIHVDNPYKAQGEMVLMDFDQPKVETVSPAIFPEAEMAPQTSSQVDATPFLVQSLSGRKKKPKPSDALDNNYALTHFCNDPVIITFADENGENERDIDLCNPPPPPYTTKDKLVRTTVEKIYSKQVLRQLTVTDGKRPKLNLLKQIPEIVFEKIAMVVQHRFHYPIHPDPYYVRTVLRRHCKNKRHTKRKEDRLMAQMAADSSPKDTDKT